MPGHQYKSTNNNSQVIMSPPESIYLITLGPEYFNTAGSQEKKTLKLTLGKWWRSLKRKWINPIKKAKTKQQLNEINRTVQYLKLKIETIKKHKIKNFGNEKFM